MINLKMRERRGQAYLFVTVWRQSDLDHPGNLALTAGEPKMDVLERLAELRFHRTPLEIVLRLLPESTRSMKIDPKRDYRIYVYAYDWRENPILYLNFDITDWHRDLRQKLPLYLTHGQERGGSWRRSCWSCPEITALLERSFSIRCFACVGTSASGNGEVHLSELTASASPRRKRRAFAWGPRRTPEELAPPTKAR